MRTSFSSMVKVTRENAKETADQILHGKVPMFYLVQSEYNALVLRVALAVESVRTHTAGADGGVNTDVHVKALVKKELILSGAKLAGGNDGLDPDNSDVGKLNAQVPSTFVTDEEALAKTSESSEVTLGMWRPDQEGVCGSRTAREETSFDCTEAGESPSPRLPLTRLSAALLLQCLARGFLARRKLRRKRLANWGHGFFEFSISLLGHGSSEDGEHGGAQGTPLSEPHEFFVGVDDIGVSGPKDVRLQLSPGTLEHLGNATLVIPMEFVPISCANSPASTLIGQLVLRAPRLTLDIALSLGSTLEEDVVPDDQQVDCPFQALSLRVMFRAGPFRYATWTSQCAPFSAKEIAACPLETMDIEWEVGHVFSLLEFTNLPMVVVGVRTTGHGAPTAAVRLRSTREAEEDEEDEGFDAAACLCLPTVATAETVALPVDLLAKLRDSCSQLPRSLELGLVEVTYRWDPEAYQCHPNRGSLVLLGTLAVMRVKWLDMARSPARVLERDPAPMLTLRVQLFASTQWDSGTLAVAVPPDGTINRVFEISWHRHGLLKDIDQEIEEYFAKAPDWEAMRLAKQLQYQVWPRRKLVLLTGKREAPWLKCFPYSALFTRKQRYGTMSTVLLFASMIVCLLFRADCTHVPKERLCFVEKRYSILARFFSWDVLFASVWGILFAVPLPLLMLQLFKKRVVLAKTSERHKRIIVNIWVAKELAGWTLIVLIQAFCVLFIFQFLRFYQWAVVFKWCAAVGWSVFHRFITAPGIRMVWVLLLMFLSQKSSLCDWCVLMSPSMTTFPQPVKLPKAARPHNESGRDLLNGDRSGKDRADVDEDPGADMDMGMD